MSRRTQITLTDRQHALLLDESHRTGLSLAELVRRAVDCVYRPYARPRVRGFELSVGVWRAPDAATVARRVRTQVRREDQDVRARPARGSTQPTRRSDRGALERPP